MTTVNIAVLFTDIVGSTEMQSKLSPETADEFRRDHFLVLRQAIAETGGTEVKNLGDGLMAAFDSASSAISCAVAMHQGVEIDGRGRPEHVEIRIGLSGGEVTREDGDYFGDPVIEAARLCAVCEPGHILASTVVALMAGRRNPHPTQSIGPIRLKGLPGERPRGDGGGKICGACIDTELRQNRWCLRPSRLSPATWSSMNPPCPMKKACPKNQGRWERLFQSRWSLRDLPRWP